MPDRLVCHGKRPTFFQLLTIFPKDALVKAKSRTCHGGPGVAVPLWIFSPILPTLITAFASLVWSEPCRDVTAQLPLEVSEVS